MHWLQFLSLSSLALSCTAIATSKKALLVIDVQNCFTEGGSLAVPGGDDIVPIINSIRSGQSDFFDLIILSQDYHPSDHISFASTHGAQPFSQIELNCEETECCPASDPECTCTTSTCVQITQTLWPDHCVANTDGAEFHQDLIISDSDIIVRKGELKNVDSYSAFLDNNKSHKTELDSLLQSAGITDVYVCGLALDYCVFFTAMDGRSLGYNTYVIEDASRGITQDGIETAKTKLEKDGIQLIESKDIPCNNGLYWDVDEGKCMPDEPLDAAEAVESGFDEDEDHSLFVAVFAVVAMVLGVVMFQGFTAMSSQRQEQKQK